MNKDKTIFACYEEIKQREIEELKEKIVAFGGCAQFGTDYTGKDATGTNHPHVCIHGDDGPYDVRIEWCSYRDDVLVIMGYDEEAGQPIDIDIDDIAYGHIEFISDNIPARTFSQESFCISRLSREDLEEKGFDTSNIDDKTMQRIADKLGDDYCEQLFWTSLEIIAEEGFNIPRKEGWTEDEDEDDE